VEVKLKPIGHVSTNSKKIPRNWTISNVEGNLIIKEEYREGLQDIKPGQRIIVLFHFHKSPKFTSKFLRIKPPIHNQKLGVFSTHSPIRPNPIGISSLEVLAIHDSVIKVKGVDMIDGTPILDIKSEFQSR
jgi:tRNA-Thr(GGU) m(6)t(6)A37 methyltransferase TsaA